MLWTKVASALEGLRVTFSRLDMMFDIDGFSIGRVNSEICTHVYAPGDKWVIMHVRLC